MRYGVLADVHANLPALEAMIAALDEAGVDAWLCLGDLVGFGPFPNECVARVSALHAEVVAGNHDLVVAGRLPLHGSPLAQETMLWTRDALEPGAREYLVGLPLERRIGEHVVMTHGAIGDPRRYVTRSSDAAEQLRTLARRDPRAGMLLVGHTHRATAFGQRRGTRLYLGRGVVDVDRADRWLINPGSVGQSRQASAAARALLLDTATDRAAFVAASYDTRSVRDALRRSGLPDGTYHRRPPLWKTATARRLRRRMSETWNSAQDARGIG